MQSESRENRKLFKAKKTQKIKERLADLLFNGIHSTSPF